MSNVVNMLVAVALIWSATRDWRYALAAFLLWTTWPNYEGPRR